MIFRKYYYHDWQMGRKVIRYNFSGEPTGEFTITNLSPRCIFLDDHSKWFRTGEREGQNWDGNYHGYIEVIPSEEEKTRSALLSEINRVDWNSIDLNVLKRFVEILNGP